MSLSALHELQTLYKEAMGEGATSDTRMDFEETLTDKFPGLFNDVQHMTHMLSTTNDKYTININGGNVFSFRAECMYDIETLRCRLLSDRRVFIMDTQPLSLPNGNGEMVPIPDVTAEITINLTEQQLRRFMYDQQDSHVMAQTLRPCPRAQNSFDRDYQY